MLPPRNKLTICFAHVAYRFQERLALRDTGLQSFEARSREELDARIGEADVLLVSGLWRNELAESATRLRFIQSISAGVDQYDRSMLAAHNIRLASAAGANARAVSEHALALMLALNRRIPEARDNQGKRVWRGMIGDLTQREDELGGKTLLIIGIGRIGGRLARLAKAFDMRVLGTRRDPSAGGERRGRGVHQCRVADAAAAGGFRRAHLPDHARDDAHHQRWRARADEAIGLAGERCARALCRRARADLGTYRGAHRRRGARLRRRGAAAGELAALGDVERADHAAYRRRDARL